ncbi:SigB/SigF/SigG family RNA polymerase sigma factor [Streptomyces sp. Ru73]|uniref:SigB/SigF/SigG family RNA polymerase sigma factor n=1 Tax=Streptomyces sp. Ru73 TaxID=2080748 RepID=UPI0021560E48|nr:SigB/SigF/SigG family RNA polymerase sigma factor [Streptomyces sp. Ru73]
MPAGGAPPRSARRGGRPHEAPDTAEDFRRLAALPDGAERAVLRDRVISAWLPLSERLAVRFHHRGEAAEDLRQVAAVGLVKAVDRYDPAQGTEFESFAIPTILGEIKRHFRDHLWSLHVPRRVQELRTRVRKARQELMGDIDDNGPSVEAIARHTGMSKEDVVLGSQALYSFTALSLDAEMPGAGNGYSLTESLGITEAGFDLAVDRETVRPHLARLPVREREILYLRFFRDQTHRRIAERLGVSQMYVARTISRACKRIAEQIGAREQPGRRTAART